MKNASAPLGRTLRLVANRTGQRHARQLSRLGITLAESELLRTLFNCGAVAPSVIADRMGLTRGAVSKLVDRLRAKRLVVRAAGGTDDRRFQTLALTGAGATLIPALVAAEAASEAASFAALSESERTALLAMLSSLSDGA